MFILSVLQKLFNDLINENLEMSLYEILASFLFFRFIVEILAENVCVPLELSEMFFHCRRENLVTAPN